MYIDGEIMMRNRLDICGNNDTNDFDDIYM